MGPTGLAPVGVERREGRGRADGLYSPDHEPGRPGSAPQVHPTRRGRPSRHPSHQAISEIRMPTLGRQSTAFDPAVDLGPAHLAVEALTLRYGSAEAWALEDVSFSVPEGTRVAVVGPNGAGKSTLFKAMVGLLRPETGRVLVHGLPFGHDKDCVAYVPQREEVDWRFPLSVQDVVLMGRYARLGWFRRPGRSDRAAAMDCLERLGIVSLAQRPIGDLSGGQQQRVFLARALAQEPHILLLDEPFAGVDVTSQELVLDLLDDLRRRRVTVIVATHDLQLAAERFDQVLLLNRRLLAFGPAEAVFNAEQVKAAFGRQALVLEGLLLVDQGVPAPRAGALFVDGGADHAASATPGSGADARDPARGRP
jgi:ABC-type Mn2+/Zn2+ transport system ATPase subunit